MKNNKKKVLAKTNKSLPKKVIKKIVKETFAKYGEALRKLSHE